MSYWRLHYHLVWATYERYRLITPAREQIIRDMISGKCQELAMLLHALGSVDDHVHMVVSVPPKLALAECVRQIKGASSHAVNHTATPDIRFGWQDGYGALTLSEERLRWAINYVRNQRTHHTVGTLVPVFEQTDPPT